MSLQDNDENLQELMSIFQTESEEIVESVFANLEEYTQKPQDRELVDTLYRELHSLKGAVRMVGFSNIQSIIHKIEDIFDIVKTQNFALDKEKIIVITKSLEIASKYIEESIKHLFCVYCGKQILPNVKFCNYCGKENKRRIEIK